MKYIVYGWAYIQDMLEHAIIMEQTGMEEDIGVEVQQFPYPCYTWDRYNSMHKDFALKSMLNIKRNMCHFITRM